MDFSSPLFLISIITGPIFILAGFVMLKVPPKWPNQLYGYRTSRSMENEENWNFAQSYSAKEMMKSGAVFTLIAAVSPLINLDRNVSVILGMALCIVFAAYPIIKTEKALKKFKA